MNSERKRRRKLLWAIVTLAALAPELAIAATAGPALTLRAPVIAAPRYGIRAAWPHWILTPHSSGPKSLSSDSPTPSGVTPTLVAAAPAPPRSSDPVLRVAQPPLTRPVESTPASSPAAESPSPSRPALQPALIQRELLTRRVQQAITGASSLTAADRQNLAMEALATLQAAPESAPTPGDPIQQIGLDRQRIGSALGLLGGAAAGFAFDTVRGRGGSIRRQQWQVGGDKGPSFHFDLVNADAGFSRFQDLTAAEKGWAGAMKGMRRLELGADKLALAGGQTQFGLLQLVDGNTHARRMSLGFTGSRWSIQALSQSVDNTFKRLGDLTDADRKLFGAEQGIARDSLTLGYAFSKEQKLNISNLSLRAASGVAERQQIEFTGGPRLQLKLTTGRVDSKFDRLAELMEPDKNAFTPQLGARWSDLTVNMSPARWLTTENQWRQSTSLSTGQRSHLLHNLWTLQFSPRSKLVLLRNLTSGPTGSSSTQSLTQSVRLEQWLTKSVFFSGFREMIRNVVSSGPNTQGRTVAFHLNTAPAMKIQASADFSNNAAPDGARQRVLTWSLGLPIHSSLKLQAKGEQHLASGFRDTQTESLGLTGKLTRALDLTLSLNTARAAKSPASRDLGARLTFAGLPKTRLLTDTHLVLTLGDTSGLASAIPVPIAPPPTGTTPPALPAGPPHRRLESLTLESKLRGQPLTIGVASTGGAAGGLLYHFAADPKSRFQWEALRELRDLGHTSLVARECYALRLHLTRLTQLSIVHEIHPESSPGTLLLGHERTKVEGQTRVRGLDLTGSLSWDRDKLKHISTQLVGVGVAGNLDPLSHVQVSYSGRSGPPDPAIPDHLVKLAFDRKPQELLKVALSAEWRGWGEHRRDELAYQLDLSALF
jgi:hypothetical protein